MHGAYFWLTIMRRAYNLHLWAADGRQVNYHKRGPIMTSQNYTHVSEPELMDALIFFQGVQKRGPFGSADWKAASREINAICAEMAKRTKKGGE
jgi:hypothetical protein